MIKIFLPILSRTTSLREIIGILEKSIHKKSLQLHIACEKNNQIINDFEKNKNKFNLIIDIFPVGTCEENMIESVLKNIDDANFVLIRDLATNFTTDNIDAIITESMLGNDIVMLKTIKKPNKFKAFFSNISNKISKWFFGYTYYVGDIGIQYFSTSAHTILKTTNLTLMTKLNRWLALNIAYVEDNFTPLKVNSTLPRKPLFWGIFYTALFFLTIVLAIFLPKIVNLTFLGDMIILLAFVIELTLSIYYFIKLYNFKKVGKLIAENAYTITHLEN